MQNTKSTKKRENCKNMWNWKTPKPKKAENAKSLTNKNCGGTWIFECRFLARKLKNILVIVKWDFLSDFLTLCYKLCTWNANVKAVFNTFEVSWYIVSQRFFKCVFVVTRRPWNDQRHNHKDTKYVYPHGYNCVFFFTWWLSTSD